MRFEAICMRETELSATCSHCGMKFFGMWETGIGTADVVRAIRHAPDLLDELMCHRCPRCGEPWWSDVLVFEDDDDGPESLAEHERIHAEVGRRLEAALGDQAGDPADVARGIEADLGVTGLRIERWSPTERRLAELEFPSTAVP